jgi:hypothetical protein
VLSAITYQPVELNTKAYHERAAQPHLKQTLEAGVDQLAIAGILACRNGAPQDTPPPASLCLVEMIHEQGDTSAWTGAPSTHAPLPCSLRLSTCHLPPDDAPASADAATVSTNGRRSVRGMLIRWQDFVAAHSGIDGAANSGGTERGAGVLLRAGSFAEVEAESALLCSATKVQRERCCWT